MHARFGVSDITAITRRVHRVGCFWRVGPHDALFVVVGIHTHTRTRIHAHTVVTKTTTTFTSSNNCINIQITELLSDYMCARAADVQFVTITIYPHLCLHICGTRARTHVRIYLYNIPTGARVQRIHECVPLADTE